MIDRPRQSKHLGHIYKIKWVKAPSADGVPANGTCDAANNIIEIEEGLLPSLERETLIHEVLHQMLKSGVTVPENLEEPIVQYLGAAIGAHINENPKFWAYVTRKFPNARN